MFRFVDFQKVRIQEVQAELPRGCIPRSVDIILRAEAVETAQPGDRCEFVGTLIVVPDVGAINLPGAQAETSNRHKGEQAEGVRGLKSLGVRDLHYRMAFLACSVSTGGRSKLGSDCEQVIFIFINSFENLTTLKLDTFQFKNPLFCLPT